MDQLGRDLSAILLQQHHTIRFQSISQFRLKIHTFNLSLGSFQILYFFFLEEFSTLPYTNCRCWNTSSLVLLPRRILLIRHKQTSTVEVTNNLPSLILFLGFFFFFKESFSFWFPTATTDFHPFFIYYIFAVSMLLWNNFKYNLPID